MGSIQVKLKSGDTELTCWVNKQVKKGDVITLKDSETPDREWTVLGVYKDFPQPQRGWKVGGIT
jgi:hypothetical protein